MKKKIILFCFFVMCSVLAANNAQAEVVMVNPTENQVAQDGLVLKATTNYISTPASLSFSVREPGGSMGTPIGYEDLNALLTGTLWGYSFDTTVLQDGYYMVFAKARMSNGAETWSAAIPFRIINWVLIPPEPTESPDAGTTVPITFSVKIASNVDPQQPFVYNEALEIRIYRCSNSACSSRTLMQTSTHGTGQTDYQIDQQEELYITHFTTEQKPETYLIEVRRPSQNFFLGSFILDTQALVRPVPDTGQTQSYTNTYGEDVDYAINSPSYMKLDASSYALSDSATVWAMVRDNVTGLIWEIKTDDGSIHDKDNTYTLAEAQDTFISQLNNQNFGGRNDWRIPTVQELAGLVDSSNFNPAINTVYFPNTLSDYYWSSDTKASSNTMAWLFYFLSGVVWSGGEQYAGHVMAVSGLPAVNVFIDNNDGTITDLSTGLMWQKYALSDYTWEQALTFCENLNMAGYKDWRLPTWKELLSILDYSSYNPAINITFFPGTEPGWYWSSTTYMANHSLKWNVLFDYGQVLFSNGELNNYYVRAVRGGQGGSIQNNVISGQVSIKDLGLGNVTMTLSGAAQRTTISKPPYYGTFSFDYIANGQYTVTPSLAGYSFIPPSRTVTILNQSLTDMYFTAVPGSTVIELASFTATPLARKVIIEWTTESETDATGFNLYRAESADGDYKKINSVLIPARGSSTQGAAYEFIDKKVMNRKTFYYKLEDVDLSGKVTMHGPVNATLRLINMFNK